MTGMRISLSLKKRVRILEETVVFLNALSSEIKFSKNNIIKILSDLSSYKSLNNLLYLDCFASVTEYADFRNMWIAALKSFPYYKREEKEKMLQLGNQLGVTDTDNQINTIKLFIVFFENYLNVAKAEYEKYGKTASLFGLFTGASAFILLI